MRRRFARCCVQNAQQNIPVVDILERRAYVSDSPGTIYVATNAGDGSIGEYSASGQTLNASLISGIGSVDYMAGSGKYLGFTTADGGQEITTSGEYVQADFNDATEGITISNSRIFAVEGAGYLPYQTPGSVSECTVTGSLINSELISGLDNPSGIAVSGSDLFVADNSDNIISEYTTSGALVKRNFISGILNPLDIAVSGSDLFVVAGGWIGEYTTTGKTINAHLIVAGSPEISVVGSDIFFTTDDGVAEYTTSGKVVNANLISGLDSPSAIYVSDDQSSAPGAPSIASTIDSANLPPTAISGKKINPKISLNLSNQGSAIKGKVNISLYVNTAPNLNGNQVLVGSVHKSISIKSGKNINIQCKVLSLPSTLAAGTYHVLIDIIDPTNESNVLATSQTVQVLGGTNKRIGELH
jgi:hypothetical protein